jgi:hypothetical protein
MVITTNLKILLINAENLFLLSDQEISHDHLKLDEGQWQRLSTSVYENKSLLKTRALAHAILEENPDLILLCEVGGLESLRNFNRLFLNDQYSAALVEGNSDRNIDVGFLVRKGLGYYFDLVSNKNRSINYLYPHERQSLAAGMATAGGKTIQSHRFSRDAAELHLFLHNRDNPFLIFLLTHLKSRLDPDGIDPNGFERRQAEMRTLLEIYEDLERRFDGKVPILMGGDLNGQAGRHAPDLEFSEIYQRTKLEDVCELAKLPHENRATYYQVGRNHKVEGRQLDYCFLSPTLAPYLKTESVHVYRYRDHLGIPLDPPTTLEAKTLLPSDHYPLVFELVGVPVF